MSVSVVCFSSFFSDTRLLLGFSKHQSLLLNYDLRPKFVGSYAHKTPLDRHVNPRLLIELALRKPSLSPLDTGLLGSPIPCAFRSNPKRQ
jgi:hypothetical protein